ncbi:MAG: efflux RND transporter permease subunit [Candidatus Eisenbacteria bacterium]|uniref:Efflux RND transporter permease subunit n=1 Tax=Eiseniibacteriota bacterium TaxID=2212470 RepID=A0A948RX18_UNCEI|nr:efflux RND transporter permease subunit [Candidatus Eisenbacteria bacterium]MBU2691531.1 efflux RND transporter permease subunit [Candidatus Eisenbacteria bacterium]
MIKAAVNRPVAILMLFIGLVLIGFLSLRRLPVDLLPSINYPNLTVITNYEDTPADDLTRLVTQPLEEVITGLAGVRRVISKTREGVSTITVQYEWGTEMDFANLHLREAIDRVSYNEDFPDDADRPLILRWDPSARPIAILVLSGDGALARMTDFARDVVKPAIEQIQGISQAEVIGGAEREILVRPNFEKLRLYGITMEDIRRALQISNVSFPGGRIRRGPLHLPLRILGEFENLEEIGETEIPTAGPGVTIGDVAEVVDTTKEPEGMTLISTHEVVSLHLYKEVGANTIKSTEEVDKILGIVKDEYPDFEYQFVYRDADFVKESFRGLRDSLLYGALLAFFVLFFFLMDVRSPIVVGLAIPVSVFATFAFLYFAKVNLNLMSLGGLSLAAGMLVDNSIVVLENINRHIKDRKPGVSLTEIAIRGTQEVASPVIAATLTTVAVFFPVIYVPGIAGEFFRDQALTVTISLLISIFAALLLQPMLSARILSDQIAQPRGFFKASDVMFRRLMNIYHTALVWVLSHKRGFLVVLILCMIVSGWIGVQMRKTFLPERNRGDFTIALELSAGSPLEQTEVIAEEIAGFLSNMKEVDTVYSQVGVTERTLAALKEYTAANTARIRVLLHPRRDSRQEMESVKERLKEYLEGLGGVLYVFRDEGIGLREILASGETAFTLGIVADDPSDALNMAEGLLPRLRRVEGLTDVEMDRVLGNPTVEVSIDREKVLRFGLEPDVLARELRARIQGVVATTYNEVEQRIDIAVRLPLDQRRDLDEVLASPVSVAEGKTVPIGSFILLSEDRPVREVVRHNQRRQITISGDVSGRRLSQIWEDVHLIINSLSVPSGVSFISGGEQEEINRSFRDLGWALLLSGLLVYMILAAQFESLLDPLIISAVLPIGVMGAVLTLFLSGHSINVISLIGLIALLGISVNDAIVKVATIRRLREDGMPGREAILEASRLRFRPILMTTLTTVLAMVPMAIGIGTGEQIQRPLAITIIGGLSLATILTLFLTPVAYEGLHQRIDRAYDKSTAGSKGKEK